MPDALKLSRVQSNIVRATPKGAIFLEGPAGTGKTTVGVERLLSLLDKKNIDPGEVLVLVPQRALGAPYDDALARSQTLKGGTVTVTTFGALVQRCVNTYWPLVAERLGVADPAQPPRFLTLETAQYVMARVLGPVIDREVLFASVHLDRQRLYSQLLDNLNKAAILGIPHTDLAARLSAAWGGDPAQELTYREAGRAAGVFRAFCLQHSLLDFSLQLEAFRLLWQPGQPCHDELTRQFRHLIVDNVEEDTPLLHGVLRDWLKVARSALLIYDTDAGYRYFLGANARTGYALREACQRVETLEHSYVHEDAPAVAAFGQALTSVLNKERFPDWPQTDPREAVILGNNDRDVRYHTDMLQNVAERVAELVYAEDVPAGEVVVLAPFLSDALRFALVSRLNALGVPVRTHRPSRALRDEPAARCLVTLARLAHPGWEYAPGAYDVAYALERAVEGLDPIRAQLIVARSQRASVGLPPFDKIGSSEQRDRVTYTLGERYEALRRWLSAYIERGAPDPLDVFWNRLFGEVLAQPGFGFHHDLDAARVAANMTDSARDFRVTFADDLDVPPGLEYVRMVADGVIANQYVRDWRAPENDDDARAVLIAPAYTFLLSNRAVRYQFWLNVGSSGWWERLYQPLTHPYVLSDGYPVGKVWTDADEVERRNENLCNSILGLVRRCTEQIYIGFSQLDERGTEERGPLLQAIQRLLRHYRRQDAAAADGAVANV